MNKPAQAAAKSLKLNAFIGFTAAIVLLMAAPFTRSSQDMAFLLLWPLLLASTIIALFTAAHLLFDAALFRLAATGADEAIAMRELDTILERMGLGIKPATLRPLQARIQGSRRIVMRLWFILIVGAGLFLLLALLPSGKGG